MPPNTDEDSDRDLYVAIGRLVTESARFEDALFYTLDTFVLSDHLPLLFAGQSWEWYVESIKTVVAQFSHLTWRKEREELLSVLNASRELRESRNWVVHGTWEHDYVLMTVLLRQPQPRIPVASTISSVVGCVKN